MFEPKDKVRHPGKPEWGVGEVLAAQPATQDGKACQRLTIRFAGAGRKTISTAFAKLQRLEGGGAAPQIRPARAGGGEPGRRSETMSEGQASAGRDGPAMSADTAGELLTALPEQATDPFSPLAARLRATLELYRFEPQHRPLLDWATAQTGLLDPLSVFSRHDLEQRFETFRVRLDRHFRELLGECRRAGFDPSPQLASAPPAAHNALRRINPNR